MAFCWAMKCDPLLRAIRLEMKSIEAREKTTTMVSCQLVTSMAMKIAVTVTIALMKLGIDWVTICLSVSVSLV